MRQTTVQEMDSIRFGSGKFEVYDGAAWVDLGAMRNIVFEESWDKVTVESDNAGPVRVGIKNHKAALGGDLMEFNLDNLYLMRGGLDKLTNVAGILVPGALQTHVATEWTWNTFYPIENQNGDGSTITINSVKHNPGGGGEVAYAAGTEYTKVNVNGVWGVVFHNAGGALIGHSPVINYDYTPNAHKTLSSGGYVTIDPVAVRVTNENEAGEMFRIEVYKAEIESGISITLPPDDGEDPAMVPIKLEGSIDSTRTVGDRLFIITDEQNA